VIARRYNPIPSITKNAAGIFVHVYVAFTHTIGKHANSAASTHTARPPRRANIPSSKQHGSTGNMFDHVNAT
jgi:hypothetical protein